MTQDEALRRVKEIESTKLNNETAHFEEDRLYLDFIKFVAERTDQLGRVAQAVLLANDIRFTRWYA